MTKSFLSGKINPAVGTAGVAQLVEQLICNQQVGGSSPSTGSTALLAQLNMGEFPSGQRGQTVNLLSVTSMVRIHLPPPEKALAFASAFSVILASLGVEITPGFTGGKEASAMKKGRAGSKPKTSWYN